MLSYTPRVCTYTNYYIVVLLIKNSKLYYVFVADPWISRDDYIPSFYNLPKYTRIYVCIYILPSPPASPPPQIKPL